MLYRSCYSIENILNDLFLHHSVSFWNPILLHNDSNLVKLSVSSNKVRKNSHQNSVETWPEDPEQDRTDHGEDVGCVPRPFHVLGDRVTPFALSNQTGRNSKVSSEDVDENRAT